MRAAPTGNAHTRSDLMIRSVQHDFVSVGGNIIGPFEYFRRMSIGATRSACRARFWDARVNRPLSAVGRYMRTAIDRSGAMVGGALERGAPADREVNWGVLKQ